MIKTIFTLVVSSTVAVSTAQLMQDMTDRIQVQGESSRELVPATITMSVSFDDYDCSTQFPDIDALNAHYLQCVQAVSVPSTDNILQSVDVVKAEEYGHKREYHTYNYIVVLHSRTDAFALIKQLGGGNEIYMGDENFSVRVISVEFMDEDVVIEQLIDEAFEKARKKADQLARLSGRPLGKVVYMQQGTPYDFYGSGYNYDGDETAQRLYKTINIDLTVAYELN